jgi:two-component system phosphate regulon sensor histidine kinase PhoR
MSELVGQRAGILNSIAHNPPEQFLSASSTILKREKWRGELVNAHKDGTLYDVIVTINPVLNENGDVVGFASVQSDITHFKEIERLKSEFVSNVSHELRTPLTNIKTFLTLLKRGRPEKREHYQDVLEREADRLARLIQDLLDLSRLDTNVVKTKLQPLALESLVSESVQAFQIKIDEKELQLKLVIPETLPLAMADNDQMHQVIANLLGNAIAYTPPKGQITIILQAAVHEGRAMVKIEIIDSGIGILEEEQDKLFDRFFRGHAARQSRSPGTGLGLAISKEIIERHNGRIEVTGQPNAGTTFIIWLPVAT